METSFCFRVDLDTWEGLHKGLPKCINIAKEHSFPFTYYLSLGRYATGRNIFRIIKNKEPIIRRIPVWKRNHWKDLIRGVLVPPKRINIDTMRILQEYQKTEFAEFHAHGYNHVQWSNKFKHFNEEETSKYLDLAIEEYAKIFGKTPQANASPNFMINPFYIKMLSAKHFQFASDFVYHSPFLLSSSDKSKNETIVQLPVTERTIESLVMQGKNTEEITDYYKQRFQKQVDEGIPYSCLYMHAVFEPLKMSSVIENILKLVRKYDIKPQTHSQYHSQVNKLPTVKIDEISQEN